MAKLTKSRNFLWQPLTREADRVSTDGRHADVHERPAHRTALIDATPDGLVKAISGI